MIALLHTYYIYIEEDPSFVIITLAKLSCHQSLKFIHDNLGGHRTFPELIKDFHFSEILFSVFFHDVNEQERDNSP